MFFSAKTHSLHEDLQLQLHYLVQICFFLSLREELEAVNFLLMQLTR